jgi:FtsP/CotA-like multicopper oxidase with cupredoxin domain
MRFDVVRGRSEDFRVPRRLRPLEDLPRVSAERTFPLTLQGGVRSEWHISGSGFGVDRIDCKPRHGTTELWQFVNSSSRVHPMHLHGVHFRVVSQNGKAPHPGDAAWKDTVTVLPNQRVTVRPYFDHYTGVYVFHCHALEHNDVAMMGQMEVVA